MKYANQKFIGFITALSVLFGLTSCQPTSGEESTDQTFSDHVELAALYENDQADRTSGNIDWSIVSVRDEERRARVLELLDSGLVRTSNDFAHAAMIFQHGTDSTASSMAVELMQKAVDMDSTRNKWLLAAAIDRDLMYRGKPQIYGTQYTTDEQGDWRLYDIDTTVITDEVRQAYGVGTLVQLKMQAKAMNLQSLIELYQESGSLTEVLLHIQEIPIEESEYDISEGGLNTFGYQLMGQDKLEEALQVFELNTQRFPQAFNTFDSYGECLLKLGRIEEGIEAYKKSLELNPNNDGARKVLEGQGIM